MENGAKFQLQNGYLLSHHLTKSISKKEDFCIAKVKKKPYFMLIDLCSTYSK